MCLLGLALLGLAKLPYRIAKAAGQRFLEAKRTRKVAIQKNGHLGVFQLREDRDPGTPDLPYLSTGTAERSFGVLRYPARYGGLSQNQIRGRADRNAYLGSRCF
jgi:hypothetical protein